MCGRHLFRTVSPSGIAAFVGNTHIKVPTTRSFDTHKCIIFLIFTYIYVYILMGRLFVDRVVDSNRILIDLERSTDGLLTRRMVEIATTGPLASQIGQTSAEIRVHDGLARRAWRRFELAYRWGRVTLPSLSGLRHSMQQRRVWQDHRARLIDVNAELLDLTQGSTPW